MVHIVIACQHPDRLQIGAEGHMTVHARPCTKHRPDETQQQDLLNSRDHSDVTLLLVRLDLSPQPLTMRPVRLVHMIKRWSLAGYDAARTQVGIAPDV
eukprot:6909-Eustigmatos_ZCMA.PRE.1